MYPLEISLQQAAAPQSYPTHGDTAGMETYLVVQERIEREENEKKRGRRENEKVEEDKKITEMRGSEKTRHTENIMK